MLEHGSFTLSTRGNIVLAEFNDVFNLEAATHLIEELKTLCSDFPQGFYFLELAQNFGGATPEVYNMTDDFTSWLVVNVCLARAPLFPPDVQLEIAKQFEPHLFQNNLKTRQFPDETKALQWLESLNNEPL